MLCARCHSKATYPVMLYNLEEWTFAICVECHSCGLIRVLTKYRRDKFVERGKKVYRGPLNYWASKHFPVIYENELTDVERG